MAVRRSGRNARDAGRRGAQEGFGDALVTLGTALFKSEMANKMDKEREDREEERLVRKEERQRMLDEVRTNEFRIERDAEGATWRQGYNKFGARTGDRDLASAEDIKNYNQQDEKNRLSLEALTTQVARDRAEAENLPLKYSRDKERFEADMEYREAQTDASRARADRTRALPLTPASGRRTSLEAELTPVNDSDVATALIDENKDLFKGYKIEEPEARRIAAEVISVARTSGKDPVDILNKMLPQYIDRNRARKNTQPQGNRGGGLDLGN